jgi:hypothetical protein
MPGKGHLRFMQEIVLPEATLKTFASDPQIDGYSIFWLIALHSSASRLRLVCDDQLAFWHELIEPAL